MEKAKSKRSLVYHAWPMGALVPERFECAAEVESDDPSEVFYLTNVAADDRALHWSENVGVRVRNKSCRSTSVGDVIVTPDGRALRIEPRGFKPIKLDPDKKKPD